MTQNKRRLQGIFGQNFRMCVLLSCRASLAILDDLGGLWECRVIDRNSDPGEMYKTWAMQHLQRGHCAQTEQETPKRRQIAGFQIQNKQQHMT